MSSHRAALSLEFCRRWSWLLPVALLDITLFAWYGQARPAPVGQPPRLQAMPAAPAGALPAAPVSWSAKPPPTATRVEPQDDAERFRTWRYVLGRYEVLGMRDVQANEDAGRLEIYDGDRIVFAMDGYEFFLADGAGTDLTGTGRPHIMVMEFSGGAHCCSTYYIFELGGELRLVGTIEARDGGIQMIDPDGDGVPEMMMGDYTLAYAFACYAASPIPELVLRFNGTHYEVAADLMRTAPPAAAELQAKAEEVWNECQVEQEDGSYALVSPGTWGNGVTLWATLLKLVYGGHEDLALEFFETAWPPWAEDKEQALEDFRQRVSESPWYQQLAEQMGMGELRAVATSK